MPSITIPVGNYPSTGSVYNITIPAQNYIGGYWVRTNFTYDTGPYDTGALTVGQLKQDQIGVGTTTAPFPVYYSEVDPPDKITGLTSQYSYFGSYTATNDGTVTYNPPSDVCFAPLLKEQLAYINYCAGGINTEFGTGVPQSNIALTSVSETYTGTEGTQRGRCGVNVPVTIIMNNPNFAGFGHNGPATFTLSLVLIPGGFDGYDLAEIDPTGAIDGSIGDIGPKFCKFTGDQLISSNNSLQLDFD